MVDPADQHFKGFIPIGRRLANALDIAVRSGEAKRFNVAYALAVALELDTEHMTGLSLGVLLDLIEPLERVSVAEPDEYQAAVRAARQTIVDSARELSVDDLLTVLEEFGLRRFAPVISAADTFELREEIRFRVQESLEHRIYAMLDRWRLCGWNDSNPPEMPRRVVRSSNARPLAG